MPFHKERYPANWKEISLRIRARAGSKRAVDLRESAASEGESTPEVNLVGGAAG